METKILDLIHPCARRWAGNREQYMLLLKLFFTFSFSTLLIIVDLVISPNGLKLLYGNRVILENYLKY